MAQQTAVDYLVEQLTNEGIYIPFGFYEQAKQMEMKKEFETKAYWFGVGILAGRENRIEELQPKTYGNK